MDLTDAVILITGARRVGASVASELARRGAHMSLSYRESVDAAEQAATAVRQHGR